MTDSVHGVHGGMRQYGRGEFAVGGWWRHRSFSAEHNIDRCFERAQAARGNPFNGAWRQAFAA